MSTRSAISAYTASHDVRALETLACEAAASSPQPRAYFSFPAEPSENLLSLPDLQGPCFGSSSYSMWAWLRLEPDAQPSGASRLVCALHGSGQSVEIILINSVLSVRVTNPKGGCAALQAGSPLGLSTWYLLMIEHSAPQRRLLPFARSHGSGTLRMFVDGALALEGPLDFPTPTSALRQFHVGSRSVGAADSMSSDSIAKVALANPSC